MFLLYNIFCWWILYNACKGTYKMAELIVHPGANLTMLSVRYSIFWYKKLFPFVWVCQCGGKQREVTLINQYMLIKLKSYVWCWYPRNLKDTVIYTIEQMWPFVRFLILILYMYFIQVVIGPNQIIYVFLVRSYTEVLYRL